MLTVKSRKQTTGENVPSSNAEGYFIRMMIIPTIDDFISELQLIFNSDFYGILHLKGLIPSENAIHKDNIIIYTAFEVQHILLKLGVSINPLRTRQLLGAFSPDCHKYMTALVDFSYRL
ncbi:hypothetical protein AVEN_173381-1 [Araneus ventricosus]|uniref:Uncharacterized protein n=1 Tax=Araneus ventricosus TaxID=182803 RepID=A0A4Y2F0R3_ARAVE|nr:hypothetical protein AVEN_173381-1 [Araneus ventricosus]